MAFEDDHLAPAQRQCARHREPDDPGANHDALDSVHSRLPRGDTRWCSVNATP